MELGINKIITFADDKKFLTLAEADYESAKYYYLVEVEDNEENLVEQSIRIVKLENKEGKSFLIPLEDGDELIAVSKILSENFDKNEAIN